MCLAIPGKVISIFGESFEKSGQVQFGSLVKEVNLSLIAEVKINDFVLVHAGFAISKMDLSLATQTLELMDELLVGPLSIDLESP